MYEDELRSIVDESRHARYAWSNLHIHTPATPWDWDGYPGQTHPSTSLSPEVFFEALNGTSVELAAITDHNSVAWCAPLIDLARQARAAGTGQLNILPGVEITCYEGPHIVALFDEATDAELIRRMLIRLGMSGDGRPDDRVGKDAQDPITISTVLGEIRSLGGVAVAPHVDSKDGLWGNKEFRGRTEVLNDSRLRILAAPSGSAKRVLEPDGRVRILYKNMDSGVISNSFAFINVADCHRIEDFEFFPTWIKMGTPCLDGIRQLPLEPELRVAHAQVTTGLPVEHPTSISFTDPPPVSHPHILGAGVTGGMLDGCRVAFSPHQNCIIGKNYSGKSALLDCIRFGLDALPFDGEDRAAFVNRLRGILGDASQVRVYVIARDAQVYCVVRTLSTTRIRGGASPVWDVEGNPELHVLIDQHFMPQSDLDVRVLFPVEVYPQGELVRIKDSIPRQMDIVDALASTDLPFHQLRPGDDDNRTLFDMLTENSEDICEVSERKDALLSEATAAPQLESELVQLEGLVASTHFSDLQSWKDAEAEARRQSRELQRLAEQWRAADVPQPEEAPVLAHAGARSTGQDRTAGEITQEMAYHVSRALRRLARIRDLALRSLESASASILELGSLARARASSLAADMAAPAEGFKTEIAATVVERVAQKRARLAELAAKREDANRCAARIQSLEAARTDLLRRYDECASQIQSSRQAIVELIDRNSADDVRASLSQASDTTNYRDLLEDIASGLTSATNRIANKQEQLDLIAESIPPRQLKEMITSGDASAILLAAPGVTDNTARIVLGMSLQDIHRLETCLLGDRFVLSFRKEAEQEFTPIDGGLSGGEQALTLISVAMVPKPLPLLIDQPEDELGPALITGNLVEQVRRVKPQRQLVFVTHVPNIPVLGDSENTIHMQQSITDDRKRLQPTISGCLDDPRVVAKVLELDGGPLAFEKRKERYAAAKSATPA